MVTLIPRNTRFPCEMTLPFSTYMDNQASVLIQVFEGESPETSKNTLHAQFRLDGIQASRAGIPPINVCFRIDRSGILTVSAHDLTSGNRQIAMIHPHNHVTALNDHWLSNIAGHVPDPPQLPNRHRAHMHNPMHAMHMAQHLAPHVHHAAQHVAQNVQAAFR